ncbi:hypothetical protein [Spirilliplanes yamanashiensis]|uniref:Uncharacterized protein n=1 Tax=Spirilliplanes yamanashiensis TaxID=42233 RepID=A0A8J3Y3U3_9ACTN|nr:hypothetical protein [Spirilliplanes yamanashiensis]MDP9820153.1 hypothetical protein [Spirilliplanes yamanashiensis]GIJ01027.1 hypothetical protein Sya03_03790 [Spirilliplanes yamanashiensis]
MFRPTRRSTALAALGLLGVGGALAVSLADRAVEPAPPVPPAPGPARPAREPKAARRARRRRAALAAGLARELRMDAAEVRAALERFDVDAAHEARARARAALKTRLDAAVAAGELGAPDGAAVMRAVDAGILEPAEH